MQSGTPRPAARVPLRVCAKLRAVTLCDEDTIARWWRDREAVRTATDERLTEAARSLGIAHPNDLIGGGKP
jgi:hypothetical protein